MQKLKLIIPDMRKFFMSGIKTENTSCGMDMTSGSLWKKIVLFSIPLMMSQVLEVLFNMSDVAVVGKFASYEALGAVGSTTILVTLFTGFLIGMGCGVNVIVARQLGARQHKDLKDTIQTAFILIDGAMLYFRIYALGMPAMAVYNFGNAVMSAGGDTKRPLLYLFIAGIVNVCLNLIFVIGFRLAEQGVAMASIISQYISATLIMTNLLRRNDVCKLHLSQVRINKNAAKAILMLGIPAGIQNAIFAIANLFIQTGVNSFDSVMVSGNSAAANFDALIYNVMSAFYTACSSFMGQNMGAGNKKRMLHSYFISIAYSFCAAGILGTVLFVFGRQLLSLFTSEPAVIDAGMARIKIMAFSYAVSAFMDASIAASRGIGKSVGPTIIVISGSCVFRVAWVYTIFAYFHSIPSLYLVYVFSWTITAIAEIAYFAYSFKHLNVRGRY